MAKYILNDKVYDTETAEKILSFRCQESSSVFGIGYGYMVNADLYKTQKGNWFYVTSENKAYLYEAKDVKRMLKRLNQIEIYEKHFDSLDLA